MFYPLYCLLYLISKSMFRIIDAMLACCKVMCGLEDIYIGDNPSNFLSFLLLNESVVRGFKVTLIIGIILVCSFSIAAIIRTTVKEKAEGTPGQIVGRAVKTIIEFLFVPAVMIILIYVSNVFINAIYTATAPADNTQLGTFLCGAFSMEGLKNPDNYLFYLNPGFDYTDTGSVFDYVEYTEFDYFFSWIASLGIIIALATSLMSFVDRAISIALLFVVAPIPLSTAVIDDGAHFKLWRDQVLVKFLTGYGVMIGINMYAILITAISDPQVVLISGRLADGMVVSAKFINNVLKIGIIVGGAFSLQRIMALIGNLVQAGAGSNELREANMAASSAGGMIKGVAKGAFGFTRGAFNFARDTMNLGLGSAVAKLTGFRSSRDYKQNGWTTGGGGGGGGSSSGSSSGGNQNSEMPNVGKNNDVQNALVGGNNGQNNNDNNQQNDKKNDSNKGNNLINSAISGQSNSSNNGGQPNNKK